MKGVLFNVVEDVVTSVASADAWDDIVEAAGVSGAYTSLGSYEDADLGAIVVAASHRLGLTTDQTLVAVGTHGFAPLAERSPDVMMGAVTWQELLLTLDDIIHPEVRKIYPDANVPSFRTELDGDAVTMEYASSRGLCSLAEGLAIGGAAWFGAAVTVQHLSCEHRGDDTCRLRIAAATDTTGAG